MTLFHLAVHCACGITRTRELHSEEPDDFACDDLAMSEGRYRIESELGEGGMATVYLADDLKHERKSR